MGEGDRELGRGGAGKINLQAFLTLPIDKFENIVS
jgi:hypothetical protein